MAYMKHYLHSLIERAEAAFPGAVVDVDFDSEHYDEIVLTIRTGYVEPADGQQLHTVDEIIEIIEN